MKFRDFREFFRNEQEEAEMIALERAREILDWMSQAYHDKFETWLEHEASKPMDISGQHIDLVQSAVRANTLKEVRQYLSRLRESAKDAIEQTRE